MSRDEVSILTRDLDVLTTKRAKVEKLFDVRLTSSVADSVPEVSWVTLTGATKTNCKNAKAYIVALCNPERCHNLERNYEPNMLDSAERNYQVAVVASASGRPVLQGDDAQVAAAISYLESSIASVQPQQGRAQQGYARASVNGRDAWHQPSSSSGASGAYRDESLYTQYRSGDSSSSYPARSKQSRHGDAFHEPTDSAYFAQSGPTRSAKEPLVKEVRFDHRSVSSKKDYGRESDDRDNGYTHKSDPFHRTVALDSSSKSQHPTASSYGSLYPRRPETRSTTSLYGHEQQGSSPSHYAFTRSPETSRRPTIDDVYAVAQTYGFGELDVDRLDEELDVTKLTTFELVEKLKALKSRVSRAEQRVTFVPGLPEKSAMKSSQRAPAGQPVRARRDIYTPQEEDVIYLSSNGHRSQRAPEYRNRSVSPSKGKRPTTASQTRYGSIDRTGTRRGYEDEEDDLAYEQVEMRYKPKRDASEDRRRRAQRNSYGAPSTVEQATNVILKSGRRLRHIVIDGTSVAMEHGNGKEFSSRGIAIVADYFRRRGHEQVTVFVPSYRKSPRSSRNPELLEKLREEGIVRYTPSWQDDKGLRKCYDDRWIIDLATKEKGVIVSNDDFRALGKENAEWAVAIRNRVLRYVFVGDLFMPAQDPTGLPGGPMLDDFLAFS